MSERSVAFGLLVRLALLIACYMIAIVTQLNHLLFSLLKGNYTRYQVLYYSTLFLLSLIAPLYGACSRRWVLLPLSPLLGYVAGLAAFFLMPYRFGLTRIIAIRDLNADFFWSPILTFQWLVGFYLMLLIVFFTPGRKVKQELP